MTKYSESYNPPAPIVEITIRNAETPYKSAKVQMLLDTGSDITLLPRRACEEISVMIEDRSLDLQGFDGSVSRGFFVYLDLIFLNKLHRGDFLVYDHDEGIIGRDILNEFKIMFDGPNSEWDTIKSELRPELVS